MPRLVESWRKKQRSRPAVDTFSSSHRVSLTNYELMWSNFGTVTQNLCNNSIFKVVFVLHLCHTKYKRVAPHMRANLWLKINCLLENKPSQVLFCLLTQNTLTIDRSWICLWIRCSKNHLRTKNSMKDNHFNGKCPMSRTLKRSYECCFKRNSLKSQCLQPFSTSYVFHFFFEKRPILGPFAKMSRRKHIFW